jgi:NADPH:quinone reductase-like Zn-dependent oxidoreductase
MQCRDMPDPTPGPGEVLLQVAGIGINPEDILERNGQVPDWHLHFPAIIGLDVSGTVIATGNGVTDLKVGDRVCGWSYHTYAELVADKAISFAKVPETMDLIDAAALPIVGLTGSQLISVASGLQAGQTVVLVAGAAGAVGRTAAFTAKTSGAHVIAGILRSQLGQAASIGADETIALDDPAAFASIPQVDIVASTLRGQAASQLLAKVKDGGTFASVMGETEGAKTYPQIRVVSFRSKQDRAGIALIAGAVTAGKLTISIGRSETLENAGAAQAAFTQGGIGKVLLVP